MSERYRKICVSSEVIESGFVRTWDGAAITVEWGEPDAEGFYEPVFTRHDDDRLGELDAAWAEVEAALPKGAWIAGLNRWQTGWVATLGYGLSPSSYNLEDDSEPSPTPAAALRALAARLRGEEPRKSWVTVSSLAVIMWP